MTAIKATAEARLADIEGRLFDVLDGIAVLLAMDLPDDDRNAVEWIGKALRRQVTDAVNIANGDAEPRPTRVTC